MASSSALPPSSSSSSGSPLEQNDSSRTIQHLRLFNKPSKHFVGRQQTLYQIHTQLMACSSNSKLSDRTVILHGPAGIGKTEVARMYAYIFSENPIIQNIAWIDSGNLASLTKSFSTLAKSLGIDIQGNEVDRVIENIYTYFSDHIGTGLFIFDDAKQMRGTHMEIFKFLPTHYLASRPLILITSRSAKWEIKKSRMISIEGLNEKEAVTFFCKRLSVTEDQENQEKMLNSLNKLAKALHGSPLALALTAPSLKENTYLEIDDIASRFMAHVPYSHKNIVKMCLDIVQEALGAEGSNSWKLLNILAYLPPDDLSVESVEDIFEYIFKTPLRPEDLSALEKCSLIFIQNNHVDLNCKKCKPIQMSKQVQKWARKRLHSSVVAPFYYLTHICDYYCHVEDFTKLEAATACLHSHLRKLNWPGDSVKFSILFAAKLISYLELTLAHGSAMEIVKDVYNFYKSTSTEKLPPCEEELMTLLHLCQYFVWHAGTYEESPVLCMTTMEIINLENKWLASVKSFITHNLGNVVPHDGKCKTTVVETLQHKIIHNLLMKKGHTVRVQKAITNMLLEINSLKIIELESTLTLYKLLWKYCLHSECIYSLIVKLCILHCQLYKKLYQGLTEVERAMYWKIGPYQYTELVNLLLKDSKTLQKTEWSNNLKFLFFSSFSTQTDGAVIVAHHLEYLNTLNSKPLEKIESISQFMTCLAMDQSCAEVLANNYDVINYFYRLTHTLLQSQTGQIEAAEFWCKIAWLALLAKSKTMNSLLHTHNACSSEDDDPRRILIKDVLNNVFRWRSIISLDVTELHEYSKTNRKNVKESLTALAAKVFSFWEPKPNEHKLKTADPQAIHVERDLHAQNIVHHITLKPQDLPPKNIRFKVDKPIQTFTGRETFLKDLHKVVKEGQVTVLTQAPFSVVAATGGIGKTETVRMYIQLHAHEYDHVIWIDAEDNSSANNQFLQLANKLGIVTEIGGKQKEFELIREQIFEKLLPNAHVVLLVFDNAEAFEDDQDLNLNGIKFLLPKSLSPFFVDPTVIVTSRNQNWNLQNVIKLDLWTEGEVVIFVIERLELTKTQENFEQATQLGNLFGRLPIALQAAVAVILQQKRHNKKYGIQNLIIEYESGSRRVSAQKPFDANMRPSPSQSSIPMTVLWNVSFEKIVKLSDGNLAIKMLCFMAYLSPTRIPQDFLYALFQKDFAQESIENALEILENYSLISTVRSADSDSHSFSIHRMIQDSAIENLRANEERKPHSIFNEHTFLNEADVLLKLSAESMNYIEALDTCKHPRGCEIVENFVYITNHVSKILDVKEFRDLTAEVAEVLRSTNDFVKSIELYEKVLEATPASEVKSEIYENSQLKWNLAVAYRDGGISQKSVELFKEVLKDQTRVLGPHHRVTLGTKSDIARALRSMGKYDDAAAKFSEVLQDFRNNQDTSSEFFLATKHNYAVLLWDQRKIEEALKLYTEVVEEYEKNPDLYSENIIKTKGSIVTLLGEQGKLEEAAAMMLQNISDATRVFGPFQLYTFAVKRNYAQLLRDQGKHEEAVQLYLELLETQETKLGSEHRPRNTSHKEQLGNCIC